MVIAERNTASPCWRMMTRCSDRDTLFVVVLEGLVIGGLVFFTPGLFLEPDGHCGAEHGQSVLEDDDALFRSGYALCSGARGVGNRRPCIFHPGSLSRTGWSLRSGTRPVRAGG